MATGQTFQSPRQRRWTVFVFFVGKAVPKWLKTEEADPFRYAFFYSVNVNGASLAAVAQVATLPLCIFAMLKQKLQASAPAKLVKWRTGVGFRSASGVALRGITKRLADKLHSRGSLPTQSDGPSGYAGGKVWKGNGLRRGSAVDAQVARIINTQRQCRMLSLTKHTFHALAHHKLVPVLSQRVVMDESRRLGTAVDILCTDQRDKTVLVVVELKTGYPGDRAMAVQGRLKMQPPLQKAHDCALHRHLAQLAVTRHMLVSETKTLKHLKKLGICTVKGALLYITPKESELHVLDRWWETKAQALVKAIS